MFGVEPEGSDMAAKTERRFAVLVSGRRIAWFKAPKRRMHNHRESRARNENKEFTGGVRVGERGK